MNNDNQNLVSEERFHPSRTIFYPTAGSYVSKGGSVFKINQILDYRTVVATCVESGRAATLPLVELKPVTGELENDEKGKGDLSAIADPEWEAAQYRFSVIKPLIDMHPAGRAEVEARAKETNVSAASIYRWIKRYNSIGTVLALIPRKRGWRSGESRLDFDKEAIIDRVLKDFYLKVQRPSVQKTIREIEKLCRKFKISPPSPNTIRSRIDAIPEKLRLEKRGNQDKAKNKFTPTPGSFPGADYPLAVMQIDHTPADIILVDPIHRKPLGKPWITLAMDVRTRVVNGCYISLDAPSEASVAMCVANALCSKDPMLQRLGLEDDWPVWGIPNTIHVDNGSDFRSRDFRDACMAYGISLEFRPVKEARFGGHVERLLGTILQEIHGLPGTTFSSVDEKDEYESEKHACMTLQEFEAWVVKYICSVYHRKKHSKLGMSPIARWELDLFGDHENDGFGLPPVPEDQTTVLLDFLPTFERTVQPVGVCIDGIRYFDEALRIWINAPDLKDPTLKRKLTFRRDPRDVSRIWFFDPDTKEYIPIRTANLNAPKGMTLFEVKEAKRILKARDSEVDPSRIFRAIDEMRELVEKSQEASKKARRAKARLKANQRAATSSSAPRRSNPARDSSQLDELLSGEVEPYGEVL